MTEPSACVDTSVIIPTYNRKASLERTLESISRQTYPSARFEVIVVDDGGQDGSGSVAQNEYPFILYYLRQSNRGAAAARNYGAAAARGEVLIFLDDDINVSPQFVESLRAELAHVQPTVAVGMLRPALWRDRKIFRDLYGELTTTGSVADIAFVDCLSGIFAVRRAHFEQIGGMQDVANDGRTAWGDVDFGYRAYLLGFRFRRALQAVGYHDDRAIQDLETYCRVQEKAGQHAVSLFAKHPMLANHIPMFRDKLPVDWRRDSPLLIARKLARQIISSRPSISVMTRSVPVLERNAPRSKVLVLTYRWILSGYIYRGYRQGLRDRR
jgi:glycosyltransferase involved in cell wall biosynthesis